MQGTKSDLPCYDFAHFSHVQYKNRSIPRRYIRSARELHLTGRKRSNVARSLMNEAPLETFSSKNIKRIAKIAPLLKVKRMFVCTFSHTNRVT
jgi:hypothetical protein